MRNPARRDLQIPVLLRGNDKLDDASDGKVDGLLVESVGGHAEQQAQVVHPAFRDRQNVPPTLVADRRAAGFLFILAGNQGITSIKGLRTAMPGRKHAPDLISEQRPGDRLMWLLVRISHDWDEEFALEAAIIYNSSRKVLDPPPDYTAH